MALFHERPIWHHLAGDHKGRPYRFVTNMCVGAGSKPARLDHF